MRLGSTAIAHIHSNTLTLNNQTSIIHATAMAMATDMVTAMVVGVMMLAITIRPKGIVEELHGAA